MLIDLPADDAEVVKQYHLQGRSYREISSHLGIPENTIGPTLTLACTARNSAPRQAIS